MKLARSLFSIRRNTSGQAVIEIALFGVILIFLIGVILRTHLSYSFSLNHQVRAMQLALKQSYSASVGANPSSSRNSSNVIFVEDRLSPDFNKFSVIDRTPFVANGSGTMTNRLNYTVDFGEVDQNLPVTDLFVNGQHFPLTTAAYVFKIIYDPAHDTTCPPDWIGTQHGPEYARCLRQLAEWENNSPTFYSLAVNGTTTYNASTGKYDLLRNDWDSTFQVTPAGQSLFEDNVSGVNLRKYFAWQWQTTVGQGASLDFGTDDSPNYPLLDVSGSMREQTVYAATQLPHDTILAILRDPNLKQYLINPSNGSSGYNLSLTQRLANDTSTGHDFRTQNSCGTGDLCISRDLNQDQNVTGVVVLDPQLGDIDAGYDPQTSSGPQPGLQQQTAIYSLVHAPGNDKVGTYLQIKEGKLYNPEDNTTVRSISSKDHADLISRSFQLSNNTQRFCRANRSGGYTRVPSLLDQGGSIPNPVEACKDCLGTNIHKTCFDPATRILFIRTRIGDTTVRQWFTNVTKGL